MKDYPKIRIHLGGKLYLAAEEGYDTSGYHELYVWLEDEEGVFLQDLAVIGQEYDYDEDFHVLNQDSMAVKVWGKPEDCSYTEGVSGIGFNAEAGDAYDAEKQENQSGSNDNRIPEL